MTNAAYTSTVFISYRRQDTQDFADRLHDAPVSHLGPGRVFMDIDSIRFGENFEVSLQRKLDTCTATLVLIGSSWLTVQDSDRHRARGIVTGIVAVVFFIYLNISLAFR